ncbi:MAG: hypothetical protein Kow00127_14250 [Bacteroidales bacterium]
MAGLSFIFLLLNVQPYLAYSHPVHGRWLVVEGFVPDYTIQAAKKIFEKGNYEKILVTGKKRIKGAHLDRYKNDGEFTAATLRALGVAPEDIVVIALDRDFRKDRTYQSAVALREFMRRNGFSGNMDLVSLGCHARRSYYLFCLAFGSEREIGVYSIPNVGYDPGRWWQSSNGFRDVTKEMIAWFYARFLFYPDHKDYSAQ